jgi:hypothetical protein
MAGMTRIKRCVYIKENTGLTIHPWRLGKMYKRLGIRYLVP